ncbi:polyketide cyclase [Sulfitobacter sp. SK012]|uniref:nuclear transport factor 2 family protein n=1 Tax=Sulfitobacter sp. SK012 TaxID=1389005 RepID=UPI000E0C310C|nr:ester cyclase [Sulfitobacter sp. SK012]AXI46790.1 polyketide cyclase [Sulfitobacter sp. SK012]
MQDLQDAKTLVRAHYTALDSADLNQIENTLAARLSPTCHWRGFHPFNEQSGPAAIAATFWGPVRAALSAVQRREDVFFAGYSGIDGSDGVWVVSMGHLMGLFDAPLLGIPATRKLAMLRYCEFNRVENGKIVETAMYCDLLHLMRQAGIVRFPDQTAQHLVQPGPRDHSGLLTSAQDPAEAAHTLQLINRMIGAIDDANADPEARTPREEMAVCWHENMLWWGPEGIGATYTIDRYIEQHQGPFRRGLADRAFNGHVARLAEGNFGGFFGWPNLTLTNTGGFMGIPANDVRADMRVIDIYRREGDKLAENWIFIDMLHFLLMQGVDVLAELNQK